MLNYVTGSITDVSTARLESALSEVEGSDILVQAIGKGTSSTRADMMHLVTRL